MFPFIIIVYIYFCIHNLIFADLNRKFYSGKIDLDNNISVDIFGVHTGKNIVVVRQESGPLNASLNLASNNPCSKLFDNGACAFLVFKFFHFEFWYSDIYSKIDSHLRMTSTYDLYLGCSFWLHFIQYDVSLVADSSLTCFHHHCQ